MSYFDIDWAPRFNFGGPRPISGIRGVCVHTTENVAGTPAENVATYQINSQSGSYHVLVDTAGRRLRENTDDWITWSTGNKGNNILLHISLVAQARWTREQWLAQDRMLAAGATVVAYWCRTYGIPAKKVTAAGLPGILGHADTRVWGGTDHTDPGDGFPYDIFIQYVQTNLNTKKENDMTPEQDKILREIHHELTHRFDSRYDLARGVASPFRDTAIGYALEADRKLELGEIAKLPARLDALEAKLDRLAGGRQ